MGFLATEGNTINFPTGLPVPTGLLITTEDGIILCTMPVGEAPGGVNSTPGIDLNFPITAVTNTLVTQDGLVVVTQLGDTLITGGELIVGVPYGFSQVPNIGPLTPPP